MPPLPRRTFLRQAATSALALAGSAQAKLWAADPSPGAHERVRLGIIGLHGHGLSHLKEFASLPDVEVAALCDVDENQFPERLKWLESQGRPRPRLFTDLRALLDQNDLDAVSVVTPNHWHAVAAIWAVQAGKHVTVEKPFSHTFEEGQKLVAAAQRYGKIIQHGTESRSNPAYQEAIQFLHDGRLGEVYLAKSLCYKWRNTIGLTPDEPVPAGVHYDLWIGPAPVRPFSRNRFHYNWHWQWDYGNGDLGNQGVHEMDLARWGLGVTLPSRITAAGAHVMFHDDQQTPNVLLALFEFPSDQGGGDRKKILQFEVRHWITNHEGDFGHGQDNNIGTIFYGSEGYLLLGNGGWKTFLGRKREPGPSGEGRALQLTHQRNFIDAIHANRPDLLHGSTLDGHHSCGLIHLANISHRLGRDLRFDPAAQRCQADSEANALLAKTYREPYSIRGI